MFLLSSLQFQVNQIQYSNLYVQKCGIKYSILPRPIKEWLILRRDQISRYLVVI